LEFPQFPFTLGFVLEQLVPPPLQVLVQFQFQLLELEVTEDGLFDAPQRLVVGETQVVSDLAEPQDAGTIWRGAEQLIFVPPN
jgi:hypothetical protein